MLGSNRSLASSSQVDSAPWSLEDDVEVHAENTCEGVILESQIDVLLNSEAEISCNNQMKYQYRKSSSSLVLYP